MLAAYDVDSRREHVSRRAGTIPGILISLTGGKVWTDSWRTSLGKNCVACLAFHRRSSVPVLRRVFRVSRFAVDVLNTCLGVRRAYLHVFISAKIRARNRWISNKIKDKESFGLGT